MIQQGVYRHYKGGLYTVLFAARCSDNGPREGEDVVVYVSHTTGKMYTRFAREFFEPVDTTYQGEQSPTPLYRFEFIAHGLGGK